MAFVSNPEPGLLKLAGELDLYEAPQLKEQLDSLLSGHFSKCLLDLSEVSYIDSSGLALLIEALQRVVSSGGKLVLYGLRPSVYNVFEISRLDEIFQIVPDHAAALAAMEEDEPVHHPKPDAD